MQIKSSVVSVLVCFVSLTASAFAQPEGYVEIPFSGTAVDRTVGCVQLKDGRYDADMIEELRKFENCRKHIPEGDIDLASRTLVRWSAGSDCHMRVVVKVFRVDVEQKYKVIVNNIYGGCRAGGSRSGWITFERLPQNYSVEMIEVRVDRFHFDDREDVFKFPSPPQTISRERIDITEVDLKDCLPLSGQSQWVINSEAVLSDAIKRSAGRLSCTDHVRDLGIDFTKTTLIGYSFASGHCERPPGLIFEATSETSNDRSKNRYVVTASFDDAGNKPCPTWKSYSVWLMLPKLPTGFAIDFKAESRR